MTTVGVRFPLKADIRNRLSSTTERVDYDELVAVTGVSPVTSVLSASLQAGRHALALRVASRLLRNRSPALGSFCCPTSLALA